MAAPRRRKIGHRRRVEDEGEDEGGHEHLDIDDDSLTEGSVASDDHDGDDDSDTSNIEEASPTSHAGKKSANGAAKTGARRSSKPNAGSEDKKVTETEMMLHGLAIEDRAEPPQELHLDDAEVAPAPAKSPSAPMVVSSASATQPSGLQDGRRRQEHDDYRKKRDQDPAFVPNRGAFFMHDHRHAGPAANGFRPFGRGRGRGGRGGGIGGPFSPMKYVSSLAMASASSANSISQMHRPGDPTTNSPWTHDMHETVAEPTPRRPRQAPEEEGPPNGNGFIPTRESNPTPINRTLSTEKHIGNAQVRVVLPGMKGPIGKATCAIKQYTKLPDHRPPLRRDKPVRISLPNRPPRYIFPAADRSFIFIPRAMRPNQQRSRGGKGRSGLGSVGGFSRRTSVYGGGSFYGSTYSPSVAMSRRSSLAHERDMMFSPTGSVASRPAIPMDHSRPVVRLPPGRPDGVPLGPQEIGPPMPGQIPPGVPFNAGPENRSADGLPIHQPRPQKQVPLAELESPLINQTPPANLPSAFHQQMPLHMPNGYHKEAHTRQPSYLSQRSSGTPLSQIPERAIHAAPFQPNTFGGQQQPYYNNMQQGYQGPQGHQGQQGPPQQGYYYNQGYSAPNVPPPAPPTFTPQVQQPAPGNYPQPPAAQAAGDQSSASAPNLVAQEANGMVYYYDPAQMPPVNNYQSYPAPQQGYQPSGVMGMGGVVTPSPDGYYYPQNTGGMVYYP